MSDDQWIEWDELPWECEDDGYDYDFPQEEEVDLSNVIQLDECRIRSAIIRRLIPRETYKFTNLIRSSFVVKGEAKFRYANFAFSKGVYIKHSKLIGALVFKGSPIVDPGGLGEGYYFLPLDEVYKIIFD